jgi:predicted phage terminase large subunit-like protein
MASLLNQNANLLKKEGWRLSLSRFASVCSNNKWIPYSWVDYLSDEVEKAAKKPNGRLIVNAPPRQGKSLLISKWLPIWYLDWFPSNRVILSSYGGDFAATWGKKVRDEFWSNTKLWTKLKQDSKARNSWNTEEGGGMHCAGVGGSVVGLGADLMIIDDPHKDWPEAMSPLMRTRVIDWFNGTLYHRLEPNGSIILIMTRWHENDLTGYLLNEHEDDWDHINFPALAEEDDDILGRKEGEALCPERYTAERLRQMEKNMGSFVFAGLYQQRPAPLQGGMVQKSWFKYYDSVPVNLDEVIQTWDLQFKATGTSYCVGQVWGRKGANMYLIDQKRAKMGFNDQVQAIKNMSSRYPEATTKYIEDAADAQAVKDTLKDTIPGIVLTPTKGSKEANLAAVVGIIESGNVYLPSKAEWLDAFLLEVSTFPNAVNDDQVDALSLALKRLKSDVGSFDFSLAQSGARENPWRLM